MAKGLAYDVDGDVYYRVKDFAGYGKLSKRNIDEMLEGAGSRIDVDERKESPLDFALWKAAKPGEPAWDSPWGPGRPGWHIECSAMSSTHLGDTFDIHGGGRDLIFPHHENEIAQSQGAHGDDTFARYWVHNGFIDFAGEKMSKSLGNFFTTREILDALRPPRSVRYFLLTVHYRSGLNFEVEVHLPRLRARCWTRPHRRAAAARPAGVTTGARRAAAARPLSRAGGGRRPAGLRLQDPGRRAGVSWRRPRNPAARSRSLEQVAGMLRRPSSTTCATTSTPAAPWVC